jgi:hypothetical protein
MSARFYVVHDDRNAAEIDAVDEPQGFTVQSSAADYADVIGVQCNPDGSVTVGHWPDGEEWVVLGTATGAAGGVTCDRCMKRSEAGWGDTALCLDCEDPANICQEHLRTFVDECPLDHP